MRIASFRSRSALVAAAATLLAAPAAIAQSSLYPALQPPQIATREFNFMVAGAGDYGTSGIVQWREGIGPETHLAFDVGFTSPSEGSTSFDIGAGIGQRLMRASEQTPLDMILTAGVYGAFASHNSVVRLPVGVVVGHRFPLSGGLALTPFAHPRISVDLCTDECAGDDTQLKLDFDLGADLEVSRTLALRSALVVGAVDGGPTKVGVGFGIAFKPLGVRR